MDLDTPHSQRIAEVAPVIPRQPAMIMPSMKMLPELVAQACQRVGLPPSLNQTRAYKDDVFFAAIEVKRPMSGVDPRPQLATWAAAGHKKAERHGWDLGVPTIGITVVGHEWLAYIIFWEPGTQHLVFLGPEELGSTRTEVGIFRLVHALRAIIRWANGPFRSMYQEGVIDRLVD